MSHISLTYHIVWRTKFSHHTINVEHERDFYAYVYGFCKRKKCTLYRINSMPDHVHMCLELNPTIALSDFMKTLKQETSKWMKEHRDWFPLFEAWGNGYAAFTYSADARTNLINYIRNQKEHHRKVVFQEEFGKLLIEFNLDPNFNRFLDD
ncbi:MAG: IS200/IS605 family transposase [Paludibacteraceae bacterium]|nr:IS200/IS605 family transposase [Paludibacteraceae bacterium]MBP5525774.1 IS200/IS605 family transposase [Paludibacteraceae bacterium]MBP5704503.1 IS200/IS605 family transposase [Paludibacteraceae bacterium]MBR5210071.1 IS200/IS605 family transposase [Paludibacteraceae bacterium]MBR6596543.1 IS200/IS605 family transposase [Paludibacteraceae bacterium]